MSLKEPTAVGSKRRWLRYSVRTLAVVMAIACIWLAYEANKVRQQRVAVRAVKRLAGHLLYDYQMQNRLVVHGLEPPGPSWLRALIGDDYFRTVAWVDVYRRNVRDEDVRALESLHGVWSLNLGDNPITDESLKTVGRLRKIDMLYLHHCPNVTDAGLEHLKGLTELKLLSLQNTAVTGKGLKIIAGFEKLESLDLSGLPLTDDAVLQLVNLSKLKYLTICRAGQLGRYPHSVSEAAVKQLAKALPKCQIEYESPEKRQLAEAEIRKREQDNKTWRDAEQARIRRRVREGFKIQTREDLLAALREVNRPVHAAEVIQDHPPLTAYLYLGNSAFNDDFLVHLPLLPELDGLDLGRNPVSDAGLRPLEALHQLKFLDLGKTQLTDAALVHVGQLTTLKSLNLTSTEITDAGLQQISKLAALEFLVLTETKITDNGLKHLSGLTNLKRLFLIRTKVTDAGLVSLRPLKNLVWLDFSDTPVTEEGMDALQPYMPKCRIELWLNKRK